jgi:hypothetical protein
MIRLQTEGGATRNGWAMLSFSLRSRNSPRVKHDDRVSKPGANCGHERVRANSASVVALSSRVCAVRPDPGAPSRNATYCSRRISATNSGIPMPFMASRAWMEVVSTHFNVLPSCDEIIAAASSAERSLGPWTPTR